MAINLKKGERATLDSDMKMALVGLGWDPQKYEGQADFDLDASVFILDASGKVRSDDDFVFYNNPNWHDKTVWSTGDDRTGGNSDDGDDEQIFIDFTKLPDWVDQIAVVVTIHEAAERGQNFGQVRNSYVRVMKVKNELDNPEPQPGDIRFDLEEESSSQTGILVCTFYKKNGQWKFKAEGNGYNGGLEAFCKEYGVNI